jgi:hypothetical protein
MSHRLIAVLFLALALATVLVPAVLASDPTTMQVGLVIAFPDGKTHLEIVTVPTTATTFEALEAAKVSVISEVGGYGTTVCKINDIGCAFPSEPCFCDPTHYWAYYHLDPAANKWVMAPEGVGAYSPTNGAVEGFAWSGFGENDPAVEPPVYTFDQIVAATTPPVSVPEPGTLLLLGSGLAGVAAFVRLRKSR